MFYKPRPGPGGSHNGVVSGFHIKSFPRVWNSQLQLLLISSSACVPYKLSPVHRRLKVNNIQERTDNETRNRQLLLVGVMTADKYIATRAKAVYETWGTRVPGKLVFFTSDSQNATDDLPVVRLKGVDDSYPPQKKSFMMLKYMYENYGDKFEWFMRADDDVFVKTERLELFLRNINSSQPRFIGQAGKGIAEEFGLLSLEYDENYCMGGPGMIFSHVTLSRVAPHVKDCLKNLYTTHEDVELGRCVQKFAGIPCTWSYEMQNIFHHSSSGRTAFTGPLKSREVHRAITLHPIKEHAHMYRLNNFLQGVSVREKIYEGLKIRREMASSVEQLRKRLGPSWVPPDLNDLQTLGLAPSLNKFVPQDESEILTWNFLARSVDSTETVNPRRAIDAPLREGVEDVIREVMEGINAISKERGRVIDFKELLYGYYRVNPRLGVDYILDLLLVYKKYRGRKMIFPVRRHAYLQQAFGPLQLRRSPLVAHESSNRIHFVLPLSGRLAIFQRFMNNFQRVCVEPDENVRLVIVLYPTMENEDPSDEIKSIVLAFQRRIRGRKLQVELIERQEAFARAAALETGKSSCQLEDDCLLAFIDVDMVFTEKTLHHIRSHTIRGRQVYFPIVFSQFDPSFRAPLTYSVDSEIAVDVFEIDDDRGYWRFYGFGIVSVYRSDLERVGGMNTSIHGWGQEDVDLYDRTVAHADLAVFRAPDPALVHVFHPIACDGSKLTDKQKKMCIGTRAGTYASQQRLARYWIDNHSYAGE
ncbi:chondroitin sulfate synthase 1 isoform X2 [Daphnia magna]|nr:chondroitin sulfate synthase 1 isoform X2 [Daphnia magna]